MRAIIQRCLEKEPARRYQQAADVHVALEDMKGLPTLPRFRSRTIPKRITANVFLFAVGLLVAGIVWYGIRHGFGAPTISNALTNVRGYSLLEEGQFDQAVEQFQSVANRAPGEANAGTASARISREWNAGQIARGVLGALAIDTTFESR